MLRRLGKTQRKIILLLASGLALGLARTPRQYFRVISEAKTEWRRIEQRALQEAIKRLYANRLLKEKVNSDGSVSLVLTETGKNRALTYNLDNMKINQPLRWDKKWRIVLFDIPEKKRKIRDAFRFHLQRLGFYEFQKSVFIHPFDCKDEIDFLIEFYRARAYIRFIIADSLDNELHLKAHFGLK